MNFHGVRLALIRVDAFVVVVVVVVVVVERIVRDLERMESRENERNDMVTIDNGTLIRKGVLQCNSSEASLPADEIFWA